MLGNCLSFAALSYILSGLFLVSFCSPNNSVSGLQYCLQNKKEGPARINKRNHSAKFNFFRLSARPGLSAITNEYNEPNRSRDQRRKTLRNYSAICKLADFYLRNPYAKSITEFS
jgi:hypothetical protein